MKTWIQNGHVLDPLTGTDGVLDVLVCGDRIEKVGTRTEIQESLGQQEEVKILDAAGCYVMPGFVDLHVHLRDPGLTYKETLKTGGEAAARGGITTVCAMPNTKPVIDTKEKVEEIHRRAKEESPVHIIQLGAITMGENGTELADIEGMAKAGCIALSEDGKSVMNAALLREGMKLAKKYGLKIFSHCEEIELRKDPDTGEDGVMNKCAKSEELGLPGITNSVEDIIAARDIFLAKDTGVHLHLCHCSTKGTVDLMRIAKKDGISVTAEVCPHHFTLTTDDITEDHGRFKMNPPLREMEDVEALKQGLKDNTMEAISTDHAPHSQEEKNVPMRKAAFGIVGLETSAALTYTELVNTGILTPMQMAERMSTAPARILGLEDKGSISEGKAADIVIFDPAREYEIDTDTFLSKGKNTPFDGWKVKGDVKYTMVDGNVVYTNKAYTE